MEEPLTPREFLHRYSLPQLIRIHEAHKHCVNNSITTTITIGSRYSSLNRIRSSMDSMQSSSASSTTGTSFVGNHYNDSNDSGNVDMVSKKCIKSSSQTTNQPPQSSFFSPQLDLDQPFLLYKAYTSRHIIAHTLSTEGTYDPDCFKPLGPTLMIPDTYPGNN